jgi:hypothetical protein
MSRASGLKASCKISSKGDDNISISAEYQPNEERQMRGLLIILGFPSEQIEQIIQSEDGLCQNKRTPA